MKNAVTKVTELRKLCALDITHSVVQGLILAYFSIFVNDRSTSHMGR